MKNWRNIARGDWNTFLLPTGTLLGFLITWEVLVKVTAIEKWLLPAPSAILKALWSVKELIWQHSLQTMQETFLGLALAVVVGVVIATAIDWSEELKKAVYPLIIASQTIPIIAVAPLLIIWFGYGLLPKVLVVALVCFFPITVNLTDGYRLVESDMLRLMSAMGANRRQIFRMVKLPAAMPFFFSGLRIAGTYSVMGAVIGEWLGASRGLGIFMTRSSQSFLTDRVFAAIIVITILSLAIFLLVEGLARLTMPWHYQRK
ncbi:ABC transporter permease [Desulforamulus aeronauticus]|uniref:ABC-type nitrate/sulfonate/bicarbonate transport system, permease component n=1 Tax=Desulforamulus aeronauticus DSM 10349 TaxID=1121421 RepID=A0A1M6T0B4_9FIRM|nr:ABC transporter permease [Desulforamulus aeronauticus]SHK50340.1 ABC-type nitrate/sulfonate/bicarbonate transport system, permease component [Desulforamulus aeronauticus DSM 10349]